MKVKLMLLLAITVPCFADIISVDKGNEKAEDYIDYLVSIMRPFWYDAYLGLNNQCFTDDYMLRREYKCHPYCDFLSVLHEVRYLGCFFKNPRDIREYDINLNSYFQAIKRKSEGGFLPIKIDPVFLSSGSTVEEIREASGLRIIVSGMALADWPNYGLAAMDDFFYKTYKLRVSDEECPICGQLAFYRNLIYYLKGEELPYSPYDPQEKMRPFYVGYEEDSAQKNEL